MSNGTKKENKKKDKKVMKEVVADVKEIQKLVKTAIDDGADSIEKVHQAIAKLPLDYLGKIEKIEETVGDVKNLQEKTIGHVYDLIRTVNDKVGDVAKEMLNIATPK